LKIGLEDNVYEVTISREKLFYREKKSNERYSATQISFGL